MSSQNITYQHNFYLVLLVLAVNLFLPMAIVARSASSNSSSISSISLQDYQTSPNASYIQDLLDNKVVGGYDDGTFRPGGNITRGELSKFVVNGFDLKVADNCGQFEDVDKNNTFYSPILSLRCQGIVSGVDGDKYEPNRFVSKAEAVKIVINTAKKLNPEIYPNFYYTQYFEDLEVKNPFFEVVMSAVSHQMLEGVIGDKLNPNQPITRSEVSRLVSIGRKLENKPAVIRQKTATGVRFNTLGDFWALEVNLEKGGRVDFVTGGIADFGVGKGVYGGNDPSFERKNLQDYWQDEQKNNPNQFAVFNGAYFRDDKESATEIALPLVVRGEVATDGYASTTEFIGQKEVLQIFENRAKITPFDENNPFESITAPNAIASFVEQNPRNSSGKVGRVYAGIADKNQDGRDETVYFLFSKNATQARMRIIMNYLGAKKMTMLDGGGSTQLIVDGQKIIESGRKIPQIVSISAGKGM